MISGFLGFAFSELDFDVVIFGLVGSLVGAGVDDREVSVEEGPWSSASACDR